MLWFRVCAVEFDVTILAADSAGMVYEVFVATCSGVWFVAYGTCFCVGVGWCYVGVVTHEMCFAILARCFAFAFASFRLFVLKVRMLHRRRRVKAIIGSIWVVEGIHAVFAFSPCHLRGSGSVALMKLEGSYDERARGKLLRDGDDERLITRTQIMEAVENIFTKTQAGEPTTSEGSARAGTSEHTALNQLHRHRPAKINYLQVPCKRCGILRKKNIHKRRTDASKHALPRIVVTNITLYEHQTL